MKEKVNGNTNQIERRKRSPKCNSATTKTDLAGANLHPSQRQNPRAEKEQIQSRSSFWRRKVSLEQRAVVSS